MRRGGLWVLSSTWCEKGMMRILCKNALRVFREIKERACVHCFASPNPWVAITLYSLLQFFYDQFQKSNTTTKSESGMRKEGSPAVIHIMEESSLHKDILSFTTEITISAYGYMLYKGRMCMSHLLFTPLARCWQTAKLY